MFYLNIHFPGGFDEFYLPGIDNQRYKFAISKRITHHVADIVLHLEVWDGVWTILTTERLQILQKGQVIDHLELKADMYLSATTTDHSFSFNILVGVRQPGRNQLVKYALTGIEKITIGRSPECTICYRKDIVSSMHASILRQPNGSYVIQDEGSTNGTFVNGRRQNQIKPLLYGDIVNVLGLKIVFLKDMIAVNDPDGNATLKVHDLLRAVTDPASNPAISLMTEKGPCEDEPENLEDLYFQRSPRQLDPVDMETVEVEGPPAPSRQRQTPLMYILDSRLV